MKIVQTLEGLRCGEHQGTKQLRLQSCGLTEFPKEILDLSDTLEILDLSGNPLAQLPEDFSRLHNLKIAFFSNCGFSVFPAQLAACASLEMIAFRGNSMTAIPEGAFPPNLRWLILTNNRIEQLPDSIGQCGRLQKLMLAGNCLTSLPDTMLQCRKLGLLRLASNRLTELPAWLLEMPELAFLSFAGNPCALSSEANNPVLEEVAWSELSVSEMLGEGASGIISKGAWRRAQGGKKVEEGVAIKLFKGDVTSDGSPADEMNACIMAGSHPNLIDTMGKIQDHPEGKLGLVLQLIPPHYTNLGLPPTLQSCTRDAFPEGTVHSLEKCRNILSSIASAAAHLHARGIVHGDLYAHNILINDSGSALLGDFGAATIYRSGSQAHYAEAIERLEVLAFGHLIEDMLGLLEVEKAGGKDGLSGLHSLCTKPVVQERPVFVEICRELKSLG